VKDNGLKNTNHKIDSKILSYTLFFGFVYWVAESFIDYLGSFDKSFFNHLILRVYPHEFYMRTSVLVIFFLFAIVLSKIISREKQILSTKLSEQERFAITLRSIGDGVIVTDVDERLF
jgi:hypothetical protein